MVDANSSKNSLDSETTAALEKATNEANAASNNVVNSLTYNYAEPSDFQDVLDKVGSLTREVDYLRSVIAGQNSKIERLVRVCAGYFEEKREAALVRAIQGDDSDGVDVDVDASVDAAVDTVDQLGRHLDSNMDPALAVAAAAVRAQSTERQQAQQAQLAQIHQQEQDQPTKKKTYKRKVGHDIDAGDSEEISVSSNSGYEDSKAKKPKITVDFLHNPMSIKEIYDEFTKGFRGQMALKDMDAKYGKHEWRGDSRSKESKRFQRRKRLHDAIERGVLKYGKTPDEIISYIERYRGDKSLTWVMNGNLPQDLTS